MESYSQAFVLKRIRKEIPYLRKRFGVEHLALFGSIARDEASEGSDIDIVVSLEKPIGFGFIQLADYLEEKLGRKVDLITTSTLEINVADPRRAHIVQNIRESLVEV